MTTNAAELRAAADKLRQLVAAISPPNPVAARFHADDRHVTQGDHGLYDVATAETPECAAFIAAMDPALGLALAKSLEDTADLHEPKLRGHRGEIPPGCQWCGDEDFPCADVRNALAVARALNPVV